MEYYLLGRSGLRVSRLALGTMNFGQDGFHKAYGKSEEEARPILREYLDQGGNFVDTADFYTAGQSETIVGKLVNETGARDKVVLATKYSIRVDEVDAADPNAGGNGRKHMVRAVEDSLRRLGTDYIDLFLMHVWDRITPVEEVVQTFDDLVTAGKIRYGGLSDVPAWYAARAQTLAEPRHPFVSLQLHYSLLSREIELEYVPLAQHLGLGITGFGPVAAGVLSGKYRRSGAGVAGEGRLQDGNPMYRALGDREWRIVEALEQVADGLGRPMAQVAVNWAVTQPGIGSAIIGASRPEQLKDNMTALDFEIPADARRVLEEASAVALPSPYSMFEPGFQQMLNRNVGDKPVGYVRSVFTD